MTVISQKEFKDKYGGNIKDLITGERLKTASRKRKKYKYAETELQQKIKMYLDVNYPAIVYQSDIVSSRLTRTQRMINASVNKKDFKPADLKIYAMRHGFGAMHIELKRETPFRKDGKLKAGEHLSKQAESLRSLRNEGYWAEFGWTFDWITEKIDWYLEVK